MSDFNPLSLWRRFLSAPHDSRSKTLGMAVVVSAVSAVAVSGAAVLLGPIAEANRAAERTERLQAMIAEIPGLSDLLESTGAERLEAIVVDLTTDAIAEGVDPETFDGTSPTATELPPTQDIAGLGERPDLQRIYLLSSGRSTELVVLPVSGQGYQSTIKGFLALSGDLTTVAGLAITEQGDTPGLGATIQTPAWQALWPGKSLVNEAGELAIEVVRGKATEVWQVDGITGATRTGNGVESMIRFWVGPQGFGPVLDKIREGTL